MTPRLVLLLFLVSGALGLGYQVVWSRFILQFIGVSAYSYATVLASFMAGLALGSALLGPLADRVRSPLRLFAILEGGVGVYALVYPSLGEAVSRLFAALVSYTPEDAGAGHAAWAKALVAGLLLLPPTMLMGGTYPALVRHATDRLSRVGQTASRLYAVNAAGGASGALIMAFVLMPSLGLRASLVVLAVVNGLVAGGALLLSRRADSAPADHRALADPETEAAGSPLSAVAVRAALVLVLGEGFLAFTLEIAWTRYFSVVLGSSTYSFALVLGAFLAGIALGSAWLSRAHARVGRPLVFFAWTQVLVGLVVLLPLALYPYGPWGLLNLGTLFSDRAAAFFAYSAVQLLLCMAVMLPSTVLIGMAMPLLVKGLAHDLRRLGGDTGRVYAWNTWGNVVGALVAGMVLLPSLGMEWLLRGAAIGCSGLGLVALGMYAPRRRATLLGVAGAALLLIAGALAGPWRTEAFTLQPTRRTDEALSLQELSARVASVRTVLFEDDPAGLLMVHSTGASAGEGNLVLSVNGKPDATSYEDLPTQVLLAHVPLLLAPRPRDVLLIGLASGVTAGSALAHPLRRLDVVEIMPTMPRAARLFEPWNRDPFTDPRLRLIVDDARSFLSYTRQRYDVIISEPSNPWTAGTGSLFSREHYARAAEVLEADGVYLQWMQAYELTDETFAATVRTFRGAFPHVYAFEARVNDVLLLGSRRELQPAWSEIEARFAAPAVREDLARLQIDSPAALLAFQALSPASVDCLAAQVAQENTDDNLFLEYRAPRDLFSRAESTLVPLMDERMHGGPALLLGALLRQRPGGVAPRALLRPLSDERVRTESLLDALRLASFEVDSTAEELFPLLPPADDATLADRATELTRAGRADLAGRLVAARSAGLLLQSALSAERAAFWDEAMREWLLAGPLVPAAEIRRVRIEFMMATGRSDEAAVALLDWMEELPGPDPTWLVLRACEIDRGELCERVVQYAWLRTRSPYLERLQELRAATPGLGDWIRHSEAR